MWPFQRHLPTAKGTPAVHVEMKQRIEDLYSLIPSVLVDRPDLQKVCFGHLRIAETAASDNDHIGCRMALADIDVEMTLSKRERFATHLTMWVVYGALALVTVAGYFEPDNERLAGYGIAGVPQEIWTWGLLGAISAMLIRVANYNFTDRQEAIRWAISRPIIGLVMGGLVYMMMKVGLFVVDAQGSNKVDFLEMVVSFLGGFSDSLSMTLLKKLQDRLTGPQKGDSPEATPPAPPDEPGIPLLSTSTIDRNSVSTP